MFEGTFKVEIDSTGQVTLPTCFQDILIKKLMDNRIVITNAKPIESNGEIVSGLMIFPYQEWLAFEDKMNRFDNDSEVKNAIRRHFLAPATELEVDQNGRIQIPAAFKSIALNQDIVLVGSKNHISIWRSNSWLMVEGAVKEKQAIT